ncbi:MAG: GTPase [Synechocystis sp.]
MINPLPDPSLQTAIASIQQSLNWYTSLRRHGNYPPNLELQGAVREDIQTLKRALEKLEQRVFKIATFGLVSRGKSTVINALLGEKRLETGPLHGVTQWPQSIRWCSNDKIQID